MNLFWEGNVAAVYKYFIFIWLCIDFTWDETYYENYRLSRPSFETAILEYP